ncbi:hypothetical protein MNEG_14662 [Monoraphidium neglectum]|uniref:Uncharacterized protein n=1 Tax=Monoraphidium neglectum TaxID=145388 RepID=A0A0D2MDK2_9CHLO|nr:hypothetical protein MNEG_14662 [Monoraphidium neglectum]KIY93300.1 hypothetical protein MNEG_14662 [Monoraphidium neglectum]|eukprot:XP_013892320.1 hypothetical protein MNEG_14662 [Monoraphidium neglectum]
MAALQQGGEAKQQLQDFLRERLDDPGFGEALVKLLVLGHSRLDQVEAAKGQRGGGGGGGGLMSALMNMGFEEVTPGAGLLWFTVSSLLEKGIKWPRDGTRPSAVRDGLFEPSHARLVQLLAALCPAATLAALRGPLTRRLAAHTQPAGPAEKAEHATVAEAAAGLLASGAPFLLPAATGPASTSMEVDGGADISAAGGASGEGGGSGGGEWAVALVRDGLRGCSLEMAASWAAATRFALDHLMPPAGAAAEAAGAGLNGEGDDEDGDGGGGGGGGGGVSSDPAAAAAERGLRALFAALLAVPGGGAGAPLLLELKRLRLFEQAVASIRTYEPDHDKLTTLRQAGAADAPPAGAPCFAGGRGWDARRGGGSARAFASAFRPPREARGFLGGVIAEVSLLMDAREQPSAVQELAGKLLADLAALMAPSVVGPALAALRRAGSLSDLAAAGGGGAAAGALAAGADSGASSPIELELGTAAAARGPAGGGGGSGGGGGAEGLVLLLNPGSAALAAQLRALVVRLVVSFQRQCADGGGGGSNGGSGDGSNGGSSVMAVDEESDAVLVPSPAAAAAGGPPAAAPQQQQQQQAALELSESRVRAAASQAGVGLNFILSAAYSPDAAALRPLVLAQLRGLLSLQMLSAPGLQQLAADAKRAAVALKYVPVSAGPECAGGVAALASAGGAPHWSTRAAAVVHLACFWFRHCFLLGAAEAQALEGLVVGLLQDPKGVYIGHLALLCSSRLHHVIENFVND